MRHLLLFIFVVLLGCSSKQANDNGVEKEMPSNRTTSEKIECIRGTPEPVLKKDRFPNSAFNLQSDSLIGIETVTLDNGDNLTIKNWGCEFYTLTFQFETSRFNADTNDLEFWFEKAGNLLTSVLAGIDAPLDIKKALMHLEYYRHHREKQDSEGFNLGEEIDFGGTEIRDIISVDRIAKLSDKKYLVEISVATGPL